MSNTANSLLSDFNNSKTVENIPHAAAKGKTAKEIVNRHISHKDDVITEEEFKNLEVGVDVISETAHTPVEIADDTERPKDEDKDPQITTPWDLIK